MKKLTNTFVYIFAAFLAVILVMNVINLWSGASVTGVSDVIIGILYSLLMLALALCIKNAKNIGGKSRIFILLAIIFAGTAVRIWYVTFAKTVPISDYETMFNGAKSVASGDYSCFDKFTYFHRFVHMTTFTFVCGILFKIFGVSVLNIQLASAVLSGVCIFIIYLIGKKISGEKLGLIAALFYSGFIPSIAYCAVFTSENFAMPFLLLSLLFVISAYKSAHIGKSAVNMLISGALLAVGCLFRGVAPFYLSAYIIGALTVFAKKTKIISCASLALAFFIVFGSVSSIYYKTGITKYRLTNGGVPFTVYMLVGFNFETGGMFSADDQNIYFEVNKDKDKMAEVVKERLIKRISDNKEKIVPLLFKKTNTIFGYGEFNSVYWSYGNNGTEGAKPYLYTLYRTASVYYIMLILLCLYCAVFTKYKSLLCLLCLMILGFEGGLMLMEVQSRYTYSVAYVFVIIGAMSVYYLGERSKNRR